MTTVPDSPDVLVVGGGPAGAVTAALLARRGWSVVLVDRARFPRPKACGEFLSSGVLRAIERMYLAPERVSSRAAVLRGWCLDLDGTVVSTDFGEDGRGLSLPRSTFDHHLLQLARQEGVHVLEGTAYVQSRPGEGVEAGRQVAVTRTGGRLRAFHTRLLVGAGGLRCPVAVETGLARRGHAVPKISLTGHVTGLALPRDRGRLILRGDLTVGLAPSDPSGRVWNATVVVPAAGYGRRLAREGAAAFYNGCLSHAGLGGAALEGPPDALLASGAFDRPVRRLFRGRAVLVGDAAGYYDPFTGQGLYQALRSAELAAPFLHRALSGSLPPERAFRQYQRLAARERRSVRIVQIGVDRALGPAGRRAWSARVLARAPSLLAATMRVTTDRSTPGSAAGRLVRDVTLHRRRSGPAPGRTAATAPRGAP